MKLHFAGSDGVESYNGILSRQGAPCRLESFYALKRKPPSLRFDLLLDSGGFVARTKGIDISVESYAAYINQFKVRKAFNLDTNSVAETMNNQKYLEDSCPNCYIIPIYHLSDYLENRELLAQLLNQKYPYIGIGGVAGEGSPIKMQHSFYRYIFHTVRTSAKLHGLGITSVPLLRQYPWYSVDSTSWLSTARYGNSIGKNKPMITMRSKNRHYLENTEQEVGRWITAVQNITKLWEMRGVTWQE